MSKYKEGVNQEFHFQTHTTVYGLFAGMLNPQEQALTAHTQMKQNGICHLRILQAEQGVTVIATELPINPGKSVTNAAEDIATQAVKTFVLDPTTTRFIEHYSTEGIEGRREETWDEVTFTWTRERQAHTPQWRRLQPSEIAELTDSE